MAMLGLRGKSLLALLFACVLVLIPAGLLAWEGINAVRGYFGLAYARNQTLLNQERLRAPIMRELALAQRMAGSSVTLDWIRDPNDPAKRARFFEEARGYQHDYSDHSYFVIDSTPSYYFNSNDTPETTEPRYTLRPDAAKDAWFFSTMRQSEPYDIQVDVNQDMGVTKVWFNVQVRDGDRKLGMIGTGLDFTRFVKQFMQGREPGVTPILFDREGRIMAHPDPARIAYKSMAETEANRHSVMLLLRTAAERSQLTQAMREAYADPGAAVTLDARLQGARASIALSYVPELHWYVLTAVDRNTAQVIDYHWLAGVLALVLLLALLVLGFGYTVERLVLRPLRHLQQTAQAISAGSYDVALPKAGSDEIGELNRAFGTMAEKVRAHTAELETRVQERTRELEEANRRMAATHRTIDESIDYASLIQRAILPDRQLIQSLGSRHFVLWKPRNVVGGDFYVFRADGDNCLLGVIDCAGHGVAGALMTMLARAAIDHAIGEIGPADPAAILARTDSAMRAMLRDAALPRALATNMDAGLVYVDRGAGQLRFAGAKMSLYASDGKVVDEYKGGRRALGDKRAGTYDNLDVAYIGRTFYLVTDGILDQSGGEHGYGFGNRRWLDLLLTVSLLPSGQQAEAIAQALRDYQGNQPQRDDITVLSFRFE